MLDDRDIFRMNPWWRVGTWEGEDPHLRRLAAQPVRLPAPAVQEIDLQAPALHVLRGPRQVGKSTDMKLLVRRALQLGRSGREITYLALDLLEGEPVTEMVRTLRRARELSGSSPSGLILLDEVTAVPKWRVGVKALWDEGTIDRSVLVCTGSSAIDLMESEGEELPGRRGAGTDIFVAPRDFGTFARVLSPSIPQPPGLDIAGVTGEAGRRLLLETRPHHSDLHLLLERYLAFGGLPAAVAEASQGAVHPGDATKHILRDSLLRDLRRKGATVLACDALLERVMRSLSAKVSWQRMADDMGVRLGGTRARSSGSTDRRTLQEYIELLAAGYFAMVVYYWKPDSGTAAIRKEKKVYFGDPLLHTITADRTSLTPDRHAQVENAFAVHLFRRYEPTDRQAETFAGPDMLHVWGTRSGGEIDFVCGPRECIHAVEVADWARLNRQKATAPMRALPGRPSLVATRDQMEFGATANLVPAAAALWALSG